MFPHPDYVSWPVLETIYFPKHKDLTTVMRYLPDSPSDDGIPMVHEYVVKGEVIAVVAVPSEGAMHWYLPNGKPGEQYFYEEYTEDDDDEPEMDTLVTMRFILPHLCETFSLSYEDGFSLMVDWIEHAEDGMTEIVKRYRTVS